jgi:hypothetical protein
MPRALSTATAVGGLALFTLVCTLLAVRLAGPVTHDANFGTLEYEVALSFSGKVAIFIPLAGWTLEAPIFDAPYSLRVQPNALHTSAVPALLRGTKPFLKQAKRDVRDGAIWTFVRAFLIGLAGGLAAALVAAATLLAFGRAARTAVAAALGCLLLSLALMGASGLWVWQSLDVKALKRPVVTSGPAARALNVSLRRLRDDQRLETVIQDLAPLVIAEVGRQLPTR